MLFAPFPLSFLWSLVILFSQYRLLARVLFAGLHEHLSLAQVVKAVFTDQYVAFPELTNSLSLFFFFSSQSVLTWEDCFLYLHLITESYLRYFSVQNCCAPALSPHPSLQLLSGYPNGWLHLPLPSNLFWDFTSKILITDSFSDR